MTDSAVPKIVPLGDSALLAEFGDVISIDLNDQALTLCTRLEASPFPGFIEAVPAYASASVAYNPVEVFRASREMSAFEFVRSRVTRALERGEVATRPERAIKIECRFGRAAGPDLAYVAEQAAMSELDVIDIFTSRAYRVYMLGFLPGFSYMGEIDERIVTPRRSEPRTVVPKGSIGIAGKQTGIYSLDSPGGWQIIGRTDTAMFLPREEPPSYLQSGDSVRFVSI